MAVAVIPKLPTFSPETAAMPLVAPCGITMVEGTMFNLLPSNPSLTLVPPKGAGCDSVAVRVAGVWASLIEVVLAVSVMVAGGCTVTFVMTSANPGALARMTVVPTAIAVNLNPITWLEAANVTDGPTIATDGLDDVSVKVVDAWAGPDRDRVSVVSEPGPSRLTVAGDSEADVPTVTNVEALFSPADEALIVAVPVFNPLIITERLGVVCPALNVTPPVMFALEVSLLVSCT